MNNKSIDNAVMPTISIYQNSEHVAGLLQQLFSAPVVTDLSTESGREDNSTSATSGGGGAAVEAGLKAPGVGHVGLKVDGDVAANDQSGWAANSKTVQNFKYSQAYYLSQVRNELISRGLLKPIENASDASQLASGDFVEFRASFRPNELHALLDIVTPSLVAAIVEHQVKAEAVKLYDAYPGFEERRAFVEKTAAKAEMRASLARTIAEAARVDFRAEKTREFYGDISDVTAITICDNAHFVVDDEDRILDGEFSVLGKVTSSLQADVPVLHRNKLLQRISPDVVDAVFSFVRENASNQATSFPAVDGSDVEFENVIDLALPSRISGSSFKVVPIAVYV